MDYQDNNGCFSETIEAVLYPKRDQTYTRYVRMIDVII